MARYFFNLADGTTLRDREGEECADLDAAKAIAIQTAHELARNKTRSDISGFFITVTDEDGDEVFRTQLAP